MGQRLAEARGRLSGSRAAAVLGLSEAALVSIESGEAEPTVGQLRIASELYGVSFHWLLFGPSDPDPTIACLGADVAALLRQFMRDRFGADRLEQLTPEEARLMKEQIERLASLTRAIGGEGAVGEEG